MKLPPWPAHIQREIDIDEGRAKRTWDEQKKAMGLFAYAVQLEQMLTPHEVDVIRRRLLNYYAQGGTDYDELQYWMAQDYIDHLQNFQNYVI